LNRFLEKKIVIVIIDEFSSGHEFIEDVCNFKNMTGNFEDGYFFVEWKFSP